jgi:hypothetical protein
MKRQPWFWPIKLFLKRISGKELWLRPEVKYDVLQSDSWKYIPSLLNEQSIVYSLGVGDLIDFDLDLINDYGLTVHAFDPTPFAEEWVKEQTLPEKFVFHPWAAAGEDGSLRLYRRVNTRGKASKVMWTAGSDAEGAEYLILDGLREGDSLPKQLLVEYHHRFPGIGKQRTAESISKLRQLGYRIFAISETGREVCFVLDKD